MNKKYSLVLIVFLCSFFYGYGQIVSNGDLESWTGSTPDSWTTIEAGITTAEETTIIHGGSSSASINVTTDAQDNTDFRQTVSLINGHDYTWSVWIRHTEGNIRARAYIGAYLDYSSASNVTSWQQLTGNFIAISTSLEIGLRFYDQIGFDGAEIVYVDDFVLTDNSASTDDVDWCNVQDPLNGAINLGGSFPVLARAWEAGVTDSPLQGPGLVCWIGYSKTDATIGPSVTNPTTRADFASLDWTWVLAPFKGDTNGGANDEFEADIGLVIPTIGTYYYASRFELNGGPYRYGGIDVPNAGGYWDGSTYFSGVLNVNARTADWVNLQYPGGTNTINTGDTFDVFAQIYEPGITDTHDSQGANIQAWIGVSTDNTDPSTWPPSAWTSASYNPLCLVCDPYNTGSDQNDEYFVNIGSTLPVGTYYYASRFTIDDPAVYYYGGYNAPPVPPAPQDHGGFWDSIYDSGDSTGNQNGELIITGPCLSDNFNSGYGNWSSGSGTYNNATAGDTGNGIGFNDNNDDIITGSSLALNNPSSISFVARASGATSDYSINIQYSTLAAGPWTNAISIIADGSNTGDITTTSNNFNLPLSLSGSYFLRIIQSPRSGGSFYLDDVEIDCGTPCIPPNDPMGSISSLDAPNFCGSADLNYSEAAYGNVTLYWQTTTNGTDSTNDATNSLEVTTDGNFYIRAYDSSLGCWSDGEVGPYNVTISDLAQITDQPDNINVTSGTNAIFSVTASNAISYQWQQSVDNGITWTDIGGANSSTLTVSSVDLSMFGNLYQVIITNVCGDIESDEAVLFVHSGSPCIEEDFVSFPDSGWTNGGTISHSDPLHYGAASPCRELGNGDTLSTSEADYPTIIEFYQDSSNGGEGMTATVEYKISSGIWTPLLSFEVTTSGKTELIDLTDVSGVDLSAQQDVSFRFNSSFNTWYLDDVKVYCTPCTPPAVAATISLSSGPAGTLVTISGSGFNGATTVKYESVNLSLISQTATDIVVQLPSNVLDGNFVISTPTICSSTIPFEVINNEDSGCQSNINPKPTDLFFYEIFDEDQNIDGSSGTWGNGGLITIFNGTFETITLSDYRIYRTTDYTDLASYPYSLWHSLTGSLAPGELYRIKVTASNCTYVFPYEEEIIGFNANDGIELRKNNGSSFVSIDQVYTPNYVGYYYVRDLTAGNKPTPTYNAGDWTITDVFPSMPYCVGAGVAPDFESATPTISISDSGNVCNSATLVATASEGYTGLYAPPADSDDLVFQWYYYNGITDIWTPISTGGDFTVTDAATQSTLVVDNAFTKMNYQFYCQVLEDDATCYSASDVVQLTFDTTTWISNNWSNGVPDSSKIAIIAENFITNGGGNQSSFSSCSLTVNNGATLTIGDIKNGGSNTYVEVMNSVQLIGTGSVIVHPQAAFVQVIDKTNNVLADNPDNYQVNKETAFMDNWFEYTYWSSPVQNESIADALADAATNRRFKFSAQDYRDSNQENANNVNIFTAGQDDIDDDPTFFSADGTGSDWQLVAGSDIMESGVGYASTHNATIFGSTPGCPGCRIIYTFNGLFNNGIITVPLYRNDEETVDNNWNLIGNPYPSAISADDFLDYNADIIGAPNRVVEGAIYLWSQNTLPDEDAIGNENSNFSNLDYAIINGVGQTGSSPSSEGTDPSNRMIPSGQSFFIAMSDGATGTTFDSDPTGAAGDVQYKNVVFNNSMRRRGSADNSQFFRTTNSQSNAETNKIWVNLTSDNGVFNQILVAYVDGATNNYDGMYFDAIRNESTGNASIIYSLIDGVTNKKFAIQGKETNSLNLDEIIPLGFDTNIDVATLYTLSIDQLEGDFLSSNTIYLKDNFMNIIHDLSASDYTFTSEIGVFNERFEIVFNQEALSINNPSSNTNSLSIIELNDGQLQFKLSSAFEMKSIEIIDLLGRTLYKLKANGSSGIFNLSNLSQATYIAKVELTNGLVITKKAVKRK